MIAGSTSLPAPSSPSAKPRILPRSTRSSASTQGLKVERRRVGKERYASSLRFTRKCSSESATGSGRLRRSTRRSRFKSSTVSGVSDTHCAAKDRSQARSDCSSTSLPGQTARRGRGRFETSRRMSQSERPSEAASTASRRRLFRAPPMARGNERGLMNRRSVPSADALTVTNERI